MVDNELFRNIVWANQHIPTPYFLLSEEIIRANCNLFKKHFHRIYKNVKTYYSVKTNYEPEVLRIIKEAGFGAEISGGLDFFFTEQAGFKPQDVIFDGPAKNVNDIKYTLDRGINLYNLDSVIDAKRLSTTCSENNKTAKVAFRTIPNIPANPIMEWLTGYKLRKFGVPLSEARGAYRSVAMDTNLEIAGVNTYLGTQMLSPRCFARVLNDLMDLAVFLEKKYKIDIEEVNIGGGFPSPTINKLTMKSILYSFMGKTVKVPPMEEYARYILSTFLNRLPELNGEPSLVFEPGRCLVSNAGVLVSRVVDKKPDWIFVDGSTNLIPENLLFGARGVDYYPKDITSTPFSRYFSKIKFNYSIAGNTLNTTDVLANSISLPASITRGDFLVFNDCGAYTFSRASQFTMLRAPIYMVYEEGCVKKIRREENYDDVSRLMCNEGIS